MYYVLLTSDDVTAVITNSDHYQRSVWLLLTPVAMTHASSYDLKCIGYTSPIASDTHTQTHTAVIRISYTLAICKHRIQSWLIAILKYTCIDYSIYRIYEYMNIYIYI